jgi:hypothetical protein
MNREARVESMIGELRAFLAEVDRPPGGMRAPWHNPLASAKQLPGVVEWVRWHLRWIDDADKDGTP